VVELTTLIELVPDFVESCDDVAVITADPKFDGVNTPEDVMMPSVAPHVTAELYDPVPFTVVVQLEVCVVRIADGVQITDTEVIVD
jgi:hypothetical protein